MLLKYDKTCIKETLLHSIHFGTDFAVDQFGLRRLVDSALLWNEKVWKI